MTRLKKSAISIAGFAVLAAAVLAVFAFFYSRQTRQQQSDPITATAFKLNTVVTITIYDSQEQEILDGAMALCDEYEHIFSRTLPESELYQLNAGTLLASVLMLVGPSYFITRIRPADSMRYE